MTDNRTTELLCKLRKMLDGCRRTETAGFDTYWITAVALDSSLDELEQAVASTLRSDDEYESKMDALLSRLTNGKWSKSRAYDLDFMVSCVDEEYEDAYEKERAELGSGTCEWVLEHSGTLYDKWRCSKCDYLYVDSRTDGGATGLDPNFCPNCGRKVVSA